MEEHQLTVIARRRRLIRSAIVPVAAAVVLGVAACGSDDSGSSSQSASSGSSGSGGGDNAQLAAAKEEFTKLTDLSKIEMPKPTEPVDPGKRKVAVIAAGLSGQGAATVAPFVQEAVKAIGWQSPATFDGKFDPSVQSGLVQQAVREKYDGIILIAITPSTISSAVDAAAAAKVAVTCVNCGRGTDTSAGKDVVFADPSPEASGRAQAIYAIAKTDAKGKIVVLRDKTFGTVVTMNDTAEKTLKEMCTDCEVSSEQMTIKDATTPGVPFFTGFLSSHPKGKVNVVISPYDTASEPFAQAAEQAGRTDVSIAGFGSLKPFYQMVAAGSPTTAKATIAAPIPYESWAGVDQLARILAGKPAWNSGGLPVALVTNENASQFDPKAPYLEPNFDFRAEFKKLWGVG
jgi:ribose transport system substrate-binding protein